MKHARADYDPIPEDEPVFLLRAKDKVAPAVVGIWAQLAEHYGASPVIVRVAREHSLKMAEWQADHGSQIPDMPTPLDQEES